MTNNIEKLLDIDNFGTNLYKIRTESELTHEEFADAVGVSTRVTYDWENGLKKPALATVVKIAKVLKVTIDSMFC